MNEYSLPFDWIFEVERIIIQLIPAYTLEMLDKCDIDRILPYYFFDYRKRLRNITPDDKNVKIRNGKKYRVVKADEAAWINDIF